MILFINIITINTTILKILKDNFTKVSLIDEKTKLDDFLINNKFLMFKQEPFKFWVSYKTNKFSTQGEPIISKGEYQELQVFCNKLKQMKINYEIDENILIH